MVKEMDVDRTLSGLADPTRRSIVASLAVGPRTFSDLAAGYPISAPAVSRHLRVLRKAGLVSERRVPGDGRVRLYALAAKPLLDLDGWLDEVTRFWRTQLDSFKRAAEELAREQADPQEGP